MERLTVGVLILLAVLFMVCRIRRAASGKGGCGCGCGSSCGGSRDDVRHVSVPGLSCSGVCGRRQTGKAER